MPKDRKETLELREMRLKERERKAAEAPSEVHLCVLGNGAKGSPRSLYMFTTYTKYLFNCGEGTQRLAHEYKMKLSKLEHIFVTHNSWDNLGGLLGLSLTIQDIGVPQITLHGPPNVENIYPLTRSFIMTKEMTIDKRHPADSPFVDACMRVEYIPIVCPGAGASSTSECSNNIDNGSSESDEEPRSKRRKHCPDVNSDVVVAFACKGHSKKGRLLLEKCVELGVPKGPLLGDLKNGKDVVLPSGKIVCSEEVTSSEQPCPVFLVVECPSERFLDSFVHEEKFVRYQASPDASENAQLVIHFTPSNVLQNAKYRCWMDKFPENTCHLILNDSCSMFNSIAVHRIQHMLNLFHPNIFCLLHESEMQQSIVPVNKKNMFYADALCKYHLRPDKGLDRSSCIKIQSEEFISDALNTPGFEQSLEKLQNSLKELPETNYVEDDFPEVVFLGTGSCIPSKVRNVSCILLQISSKFCMLLDCGEGSYKQLLRLYGTSESELILVKLSCIFISHMHADHHLGLLTILKQRKIAFEALGKEFSPNLVIAPLCIQKWLVDYDRLFENISSLYRFIECSPLVYNDVQITSEENKILIETCKSVTVRTVPVIHCPNSFGALLELEEKNQKIVYSGDTIPCQELITAGKNCTLLIHEATMEDDLADEAAVKKHSTTTQAIEVAQRMNAQYTILTHFSQRYAKVPLFNEHFQGHIGFAFDNMKIRLSDLPKIPLFIPGLQILFADHVEKLQDRGIKRKDKLKKQLSSILQENPSVDTLKINS